MKPMKKLLALSLLVLPMLFLGAQKTAAIGVCEDNLDFCLAGCTSSSPASCRTHCRTAYACCSDPAHCPTTGPGGN